MIDSIDLKTQGAWLIHHANKLQTVNTTAFDNIKTAGKAGILLSALSTSEEFTLNQTKIDALAKEANISKLEQKALLDILKANELIDIGQSGIAILGLTTSTTLEHTSKIFQSQEPDKTEFASIILSEKISETPYRREDILAEISDQYKIDATSLSSFQQNIEQIGLVDVENIDDQNTLYFNGNLFKRENTKKIQQVLASLTQDEQTKLIQFNKLLDEKACIESNQAIKILGEQLYSKLSAIGMFDINVVSNEKGEVGFLTKPSSFSKYSSSNVDDAFDLAKAFVSSLTYGMTKSGSSRGNITMIEKLLKALIRGEEVGPVDAIGQDYKVLELKHVVEIKHGSKTSWQGNKRSGWMMKLLKKDVGELALQAIKQGNISEQSLTSLPSATINKYKGPEVNRVNIRKKQVDRTAKDTNNMIMALRTGGF
ncbi:hypothetical protein [Sulfurimonas sp.]|uniref:hypothetical protein n=1 Tax=Sulfurimonas sp. TaxID=2022749 RepID=UPI002610BAF4|nr:hypothetical protein [Sulfurimonas sp.]MDD5158098.1 hypothetical protein [Sulfurimonas sp.]